MILEKKLIIMKGYNNSDINGVVKIESFSNKTVCEFKALGVDKETAYIVCAGNEIICVGKKLTDTVICEKVLTSLNTTFGIVLVKNDEIICVGSNVKYDFEELARKLKMRLSQSSIEEKQPKQTSTLSSQSVVEKEKLSPPYSKNLLPSKNDMSKSIDKKNVEQSETTKKCEKTPLDDKKILQNENSVDQPQEKNIKSDKNPDVYDDNFVQPENSDDSDSCKFFDRIKDKLENMMQDNPCDEELQELIPDSKWARISVDDENYYVVGLIFANGCPDLICYGVPDINRNSPPMCKEECRQWLELEKDGRGYWLMYQSAKDGRTITAV